MPAPLRCSAARIVSISTALLLALSAMPPRATADKPKPPEGFTALFNGKDLSGWWARIEPKTRASIWR